ncbi:hypothetical protein ATR1_119c0001, partial [Acetobacter tropicalis]
RIDVADIPFCRPGRKVHTGGGEISKQCCAAGRYAPVRHI